MYSKDPKRGFKNPLDSLEQYTVKLAQSNFPRKLIIGSLAALAGTTLYVTAAEGFRIYEMKNPPPIEQKTPKPPLPKL